MSYLDAVRVNYLYLGPHAIVKTLVILRDKCEQLHFYQELK